jgi:hypothetical protein
VELKTTSRMFTGESAIEIFPCGCIHIHENGKTEYLISPALVAKLLTDMRVLQIAEISTNAIQREIQELLRQRREQSQKAIEEFGDLETADVNAIATALAGTYSPVLIDGTVTWLWIRDGSRSSSLIWYGLDETSKCFPESDSLRRFTDAVNAICDLESAAKSGAQR